MTADLGKDDHFSLVRQGSVRLMLKFRPALQSSVTVIVYTEFKDVTEIVRDRNRHLDFVEGTRKRSSMH